MEVLNACRNTFIFRLIEQFKTINFISYYTIQKNISICLIT